jgi:hypothetical protein
MGTTSIMGNPNGDYTNEFYYTYCFVNNLTSTLTSYYFDVANVGPPNNVKPTSWT